MQVVRNLDLDLKGYFRFSFMMRDADNLEAY
jgi:hypothetical protein